MKCDHVEVQGRRVLLRDPRPEDVEARVRWALVETEWQNWDAPWEGPPPPTAEEITEERVRKCAANIAADIAKELPSPRKRLWVEHIGGPLLGWVNRYHHDPEARVTHVGISICEPAYWNQGLGTEALLLWIDYLIKELDLTCVRTATWSGNHRMVRCAEKCGFVVDKVSRGSREVRGKRYDGLEFILNPEAVSKRREAHDEKRT
jgi:RimJ/RimL family protein N-acetyltransferase